MSSPWRWLRPVAVLATVLAIISDLLYGVAFGFRVEPAFDYLQQLAIGTGGATVLRWAALTDMLGYYLLMAPTVFHLRRVYARHPLIGVFTSSALFYVGAGSVGAVALSIFGPKLIVEYAAASGPSRDVIAREFTTLAAIVYTGIWQTLLPIGLGAWFIGTGWLMRARHPQLGMLSLAMGAAALLASAGRMLAFDAVAIVGLLFLGPFTLWPILIAWNVRLDESTQ